MDLEGILENNRTYVRGRKSRPLPAVQPIRRAVLACYDPRLDEMIPASLGTKPGEVFLFRTAGALLVPGSPSLRSLAMAIYMFGVTEVLVIGHSSCRMAQFRADEFIESFRARGVSRSAFGERDLRSWAGAIASPRSGVKATITTILDAPFIPPDVTVAGMVLDDASGELKVVVPPGERPALVPSSPEEETEAPPEPAAKQPRPRKRRTSEKQEPSTPSGNAFDDALESFLGTLEENRSLLEDARRLHVELRQDGHTLGKLRRLDRFVREAAREAREIGDAYERLKAEATRGRQRLDAEELVRTFLERAKRG